MNPAGRVGSVSAIQLVSVPEPSTLLLCLLGVRGFEPDPREAASQEVIEIFQGISS